MWSTTPAYRHFAAPDPHSFHAFTPIQSHGTYTLPEGGCAVSTADEGSKPPEHRFRGA
jgi:hypothetical protein